MRKNLFLIVTIMLLMSAAGFAEKLATFPDLTKPKTLVIDEDQFYVTEGHNIYIYSLKDFKLKKKFGKRGEGPQEFKLMGDEGLVIMPQEDYLLINSIGRVSFFTKDGKYIKELNAKGTPTLGFYQPLGKGFAGFGIAFDQKSQTSFNTINIYDEKLNKLKEIYRKKFMKRGTFEFPSVPPIFYVLDKKIIIGGEEEFIINILDVEGNKTGSIKRDYKRVKVTESYKERAHNFLKTHPIFKQIYEQIKNSIKFADYFPAIFIFYVDDNKIYIFTYLEEDEKIETFVYSADGKFLKRLFLPIQYMSPIQPSPLYFKNNKYYQLIDNEDTEMWELHAYTIE